jgi:RNA ligase (TIGR02306 family)
MELEYQNVLIQTVSSITPHVNPEVEKLEVAHIGGWQCITAKGTKQVGDKVLYIPPDTILPTEFAESIGVDSYLSTGNRVKTIKLKGMISMGIAASIPSKFADLPVGTDLGKELNLVKWKPIGNSPSLSRPGKPGKYADCAPTHPLFWKYPETSNLRHYPNNISDGELVVVTEKLHGCNVRISMCKNTDGTSGYHVGSREHPRRYPTRKIPYGFWTNPFGWVKDVIRGAWEHRKFVQPRMDIPDPEAAAANWWWFAGDQPEIRNLVRSLYDNVSQQGQVILYGEVYGSNVQKLQYGSPDKLRYAIFDILIDGNFIPWVDVRKHCEAFGVQLVPELWTGPYSLEAVAKLADGKTTVCENGHIREGVVVKTQTAVGRQSYKYISDSYYLWKDGKEECDTHTE